MFSLFLCRVDLTDLYPLRFTVNILEVGDGDTLLVARGSYRFKLRLSKLDAPEKRQPFIKGGDAGDSSRQCLIKALRLHPSKILVMEKHDIYGRVLGDIEGLNLKLVQQGCSGLYPHAQFASRKEKMIYVRALNLARKNKVGLWASGGYRQPKLWRKSSKQIARRR